MTRPLPHLEAPISCTMERLVPVKGCWVSRRGVDTKLGCVIDLRKFDTNIQVKVRWQDGAEWVCPDELQSGYQKGWTVQHVPVSLARQSLGTGVVVSRREIGGREQLLVQMDSDGRSLWLPYENLRRVPDVRMLYERAAPQAEDHAERFRLKLLAHALENWNHLTGALDRLDVDPLPHQIHLVHRIMSSANYNWLIADDVGLGKTIEVGLLLAALKRKGHARRVLIICPAGLTRQWQDELQYKFDQHYEIYGRDFFVNKPEHWKLHDHLIMSLDLAKRDDHMASLQQAGVWDIAIFDEGHRLTRYGSGERSQRYRLAESVRRRCEALILLSGTPHQGYNDRFVALLELVRPDLKPRIQTLMANPEVVGDIILRNRKSEVTDSDGNLIFKGQQVHRVPVEPSAATRHFQTLLQRYLQQGYRAGETTGAAGRAIGFVMTTYRKLASSSIAAIERALERRRSRLDGEAALSRDVADDQMDLETLLEGGDDQDDLAAILSASAPKEFFAYERGLIAELLSAAKAVRQQDEKLRMLLEEVVEPLWEQGKKLLIFTEYRATQEYLQAALQDRFQTAGEVLLINGSMSLDEKLATIHAFNDGASSFLISTEAGGEGLNLHHSCHVMVNYDLPWNPARLVQRIGRLYRYGQNQKVIVFNLHARDSFDNAAVDLMLTRLDEMVRSMAPVGSEFDDRFYAEVIGEVLEQIDLSAILTSATSMNMERTQEQIDEALQRAQKARELQEEIFSHVEGYHADALQGTLGFTMQHVSSFIRGMLPLIGASIEQELHDGRVMEVRLPEELRGRFPEFSQRTVVRLTADRRLAQRLQQVVLLDFETGFFQYLIEHAKSHGFSGSYSALRSEAGLDGVLTAFILRWQNDQGTTVSEEFLTAFRDPAGGVVLNPGFLSNLLTTPVEVAPVPAAERARADVLSALVARANRCLGEESSRFKHPNGLVLLAAADLHSADVTYQSGSKAKVRAPHC